MFRERNREKKYQQEKKHKNRKKKMGVQGLVYLEAEFLLPLFVLDKNKNSLLEYKIFTLDFQIKFKFSNAFPSLKNTSVKSYDLTTEGYENASVQ